MTTESCKTVAYIKRV